MGKYYELKITMDEAEDGACSWLVTVPQFPEITTFADNMKEACVEGRKAIEEAIAARIADSEDIPLPANDVPGASHCIEVPGLVYLKCALYMICRETKVTRAELARRLGWHREQVDRLFRLDHKSQFEQLEAAFEAIGHPIRFDIALPDGLAA